MKRELTQILSRAYHNVACILMASTMFYGSSAHIAVAQSAGIDSTTTTVTIQLRDIYGPETGESTTLDELGIGSRINQATAALDELAGTGVSDVAPTFWDNTKAAVALQEQQRSASATITGSLQTPDVSVPNIELSSKAWSVEVLNNVSDLINKSVAQISAPMQDAGVEVISEVTSKPVVPLHIQVIDPDDGIKRSNDKTIYGQDDRREYFQIPSKKIKDAAEAVGSISTYGQRFVHSRGMCTAFLIGKATALTASHCVNFNDYRSKVVRFKDYIVADGDEVVQMEVFEIASIKMWDRAHDAAVLELAATTSGKLPGDLFKPLRISKTPRTKGQQVYTIGYPGYSYMKYSPNCKVVRDAYLKEDVGKYTFGIDCDVFGGNSGSPVFDATTNDVIGVLWGGQKDNQIISVANENLHEYVVPMWKIAEATSFDRGSWPDEVLFARYGGKSSQDVASAWMLE